MGWHASRRGRGDYRCVLNVSRHTSEECYMGYVTGVGIWFGCMRLRTRTNDGQLLTRYCIYQLDKIGTFFMRIRATVLHGVNYTLKP